MAVITLHACVTAIDVYGGVAVVFIAYYNVVVVVYWVIAVCAC